MRWCFTLNVGGEGQPAADTEIRFDGATTDYLVVGREVAPTTGQHHLQGYVRFKGKKDMTACKGALGHETVHVEPAKGNEEQNRTYCVKSGVFIEHGEYKPSAGTSGHRSDLDRAVQMIKDGSSMRDLAREEPVAVVKYQSGLQSLINLVSEAPSARDIHTTVLVGTTGTGKTHRVRTQFPDCYAVNLKDKYPWDQYTGQKVLLIDEFDPTSITIQEMNRLLDKWRCPLQARYANKEAFWTQVYICTNLPPEDWYNRLFSSTLVDSLQRRVSEPMGKCYQVESQDQVVDLEWWKVIAPATPSPLSSPQRSSSPACTIPQILAPRTPSQDQNPAPLKRLRRGMATVGVPTADACSKQPPVSAPAAADAGTVRNPMVIDD